MIERAPKRSARNQRSAVHECRVSPRYLHLATIDRLPLPDNSVDVVISKCVINLATDKQTVFREIARVVRPGGRLAVSDTALKQELPRKLGTIGDLEALIVIYDPNGGYTIGGGWIDAPAGSYRADPGVSGKVAFGFNSKYTKATNPKGETQINFVNGNLEFNALNYDYLSVSGARAQFKGFGKLNGEAGYNFILTVIDGQVTNGGGVDLFRIKIWNKVSGVVVFDTQMGASEAADPTTPVADGGNIIIQK
jgi:hypothetical protein